jgi:hypothetical protein
MVHRPQLMSSTQSILLTRLAGRRYSTSPNRDDHADASTAARLRVTPWDLSRVDVEEIQQYGQHYFWASSPSQYQPGRAGTARPPNAFGMPLAMAASNCSFSWPGSGRDDNRQQLSVGPTDNPGDARG